jgi:O-acetyl-ADP-ribose deacetylase
MQRMLDDARVARTSHPLERVRCLCGDITLQQVDAIVNAANVALRGGGGVDGAIHRAAGKDLLAECIAEHPHGCPTGEARLTGGHLLPARWVIHTVGPVWQGGNVGEPGMLAACVHNSLALAAAHGLHTVAFPAISCGVFGYPLPGAATVLVRAVAEALAAHPGIAEVRFVLFSPDVEAVFADAVLAQRELRSG